jgi:hypothetical protein
LTKEHITFLALAVSDFSRSTASTWEIGYAVPDDTLGNVARSRGGTLFAFSMALMRWRLVGLPH